MARIANIRGVPGRSAATPCGFNIRGVPGRSAATPCGFALLLLLLLEGCEGDLPQATEVEDMRVLGARVEVIGDEARTTPEPGERLRVSLPVVLPTLENAAARIDDMRAMIIGCTAPVRFPGGLPLCQELIDAALSGEDFSGEVPMLEDDTLHCSDLPPPRRAQEGAVSLQCVNGDPESPLLPIVAVFDVPPEFTADALLLRGVVCEEGDPYIDPFDPALFGCKDNDGETIPVHAVLTVQQRAADSNHNPALGAFSVLRQDQPWELPDLERLPGLEAGCAEDVPETTPELHRVVPGAHRITLRYEADEREQVDGQPEDLEITVYTTAGEMERRFSVFDGEDDGGADGVLESELDWTPPKSVQEGGDASEATPETDRLTSGVLARFFIALRDQRGGFVITERAACVHK